ncbi:MAG: hypothetical protein RL026_1300 [Pseudomonadota bacterium]
MSVAQICSRAQQGLAAPRVRVEVHLGPGLPSLTVVGLPAPAIRESRERVRAALVHSGYDFPAGRITVNLAPADLPKEGSRFDLAIALGILIASDQLQPLPGLLDHCEVYGELALTGELEPVPGLLLAGLHAGSARPLLAPTANAGDLARAGMQRARQVATLREAAQALAVGWGEQLPEVGAATLLAPAGVSPDECANAGLHLVRGHAEAKVALAAAAVGGHSLLMVGPPGCGKSLLAHCLQGLLPPLTPSEAVEVATIRELAAPSLQHRPLQRPFRSPHHTASAQAIVGGGAGATPGEVTLAHHGVLFLDELPEFDRRVLESLREPLETGVVRLARAARSVDYPAVFQLVAAMNPCPCGRAGMRGGCRCKPAAVRQYQNRLSGPFLDRMDITLPLQRPTPIELLAAPDPPETTRDLCRRVAMARVRQLQRQGCLNSRLPAQELERHCRLSGAARLKLTAGLAAQGLSGRGMHRVLRLARSLADLEGLEEIDEGGVSRALDWRPDRIFKD